MKLIIILSIFIIILLVDLIECIGYVLVFDYNENVGRLNRSSVLKTDYDTLNDRIKFDLILNWRSGDSYFYPKWYAIGFNENKNPKIVS